MQVWIPQLDEFAIYVPCAGHILNLVGVKAAECYLRTVKFFDFVQCLYSFFWCFYSSMKCIASSLGKGFVVKHLSDTRWSAHFDAVHALYGGFEELKHALDSVSAGNEQEMNTRREVEGLSKKMKTWKQSFSQFFGMTC